MTILSVIQAVATKVGVEIPTSVFAQSGRTEIELKETANECAQQIISGTDWSALLKVATVVGTGTVTEFPLSTIAPDFLRLTKAAELWTENQAYDRLVHVDNINDWLQQDSHSIGWVGGCWIMYGGSLFIKAGEQMPLPLDDEIRFPYISRNIVKPATGANKDAFTADTDTFVINERLLKLSMIWNWKSAHNQPYQQEFDEYQIALGQLEMSDKAPGIIRSGRHGRGSLNVGFV